MNRSGVRALGAAPPTCEMEIRTPDGDDVVCGAEATTCAADGSFFCPRCATAATECGLDVSDGLAYAAVRPYDDEMLREDGWRLHLSWQPGNLVSFAAERVFPEKVADPTAQAVRISEEVTLTEAEVEWLHGQFGLLLAQMRRAR